MTGRGSGATSRRRLLGATAALGVGAALTGRLAAAQDADAALVGALPAWSVAVHAFQDPYGGQIVAPAQLDPTRRYVGADVEVRNDSDRPLVAAPGQFRLGDADAVEYQAGGVSGSDPRLFEVNMLPGERVRGWIYFAVPADAQLIELVYNPPVPRVSMPLPDATAPGGTPTAGGIG